MTIAKDARISKLRWLWNKVRYGLFLQVFRNVLSRIGLEIRPYYWVQEALAEMHPPEIKKNEADYTLEFLGPDDMQIISARADGYKLVVVLEQLKNGKKCISLKYKG